MQKILLTKKNNKGFSLVEVVMAIGVLSIGLLAVSQLFSKNIKEMMEIRDQTTAISLAQEGVELVRNYHDNTPLTPSNNNDKKVHINSGNVELLNNADYTLYYSAGSPGTFSHLSMGSVATRFKRKIVINASSSPKTVTSYVTWDDSTPPSTTTVCNTATKCIYATMQLFD